MGHLSQFEADPFAARGILPSDGFRPDLVADDETSTGLHAAFRVVVELVLPSVDLGGTDVEARFLFAIWTYCCVDCDERFRIFAEADECESLVQGQGFFFRHG